MRETVEVARRAAQSSATVLITGETGTGKEVIAGFVHAESPRSDGPFVKVNCAALPETLLESELFGHERGAFTGADQRRIGRFEQASGGTLLLDEIAELSPATQAKLLRVVQDQEFHRLGGTTLLRTDARILAATNCDLVDWLADGSFRADLYYRLNVIGIHLPPLRERPEDLLVLAERFRELFAGELDRPVRCFSAGARRQICAHPWPGNVRQLRNAVERAVVMCDTGVIHGEDLALSAVAPGETSGGFKLQLPPDGIALAEIERLAVEEALRRSGYVQKDAARLLRVTRRQLNYAIRRMGLTHSSWRKNRGEDDPRRDI